MYVLLASRQLAYSRYLWYSDVRIQNLWKRTFEDLVYIHESSESTSQSARLLVVFGFFINSSLHLIHTWSSSSVLPNPRKHLLKTLNVRISSDSK